eukprot:scaffold125617_cov46-Tisochrysis_lutea.AAC.1
MQWTWRQVRPWIGRSPNASKQCVPHCGSMVSCWTLMGSSGSVGGSIPTVYPSTSRRKAAARNVGAFGWGVLACCLARRNTTGVLFVPVCVECKL